MGDWTQDDGVPFGDYTAGECDYCHADEVLVHVKEESDGWTRSVCSACEYEQEQKQYETEAAAHYYLEVSPLISEAAKSQQYWELGGNDGPEPLAALIAGLEQAIAEAREMRGHEHKWNENDYCDICGRDGRV